MLALLNTSFINMSNSITDDSLKGIVNPKIKSLTSFTLSEDTEDMLKNVNNHTVCCQHSTVWLPIFFKKNLLLCSDEESNSGLVQNNFRVRR